MNYKKCEYKTKWWMLSSPLLMQHSSLTFCKKAQESVYRSACGRPSCKIKLNISVALLGKWVMLIFMLFFTIWKFDVTCVYWCIANITMQCRYSRTKIICPLILYSRVIILTKRIWNFEISFTWKIMDILYKIMSLRH